MYEIKKLLQSILLKKNFFSIWDFLKRIILCYYLIKYICIETAKAKAYLWTSIVKILKYFKVIM